MTCRRGRAAADLGSSHRGTSARCLELDLDDSGAATDGNRWVKEGEGCGVAATQMSRVTGFIDRRGKRGISTMNRAADVLDHRRDREGDRRSDIHHCRNW